MVREPPNRWPAPTHVPPLCLQGNLDLKSDPWPKVRPGQVAAPRLQSHARYSLMHSLAACPDCASRLAWVAAGLLGLQQPPSRPLLPPTPTPQISEEAKDCVRRMLEPNPAKRATAQEILQVGRGGVAWLAVCGPVAPVLLLRCLPLWQSGCTPLQWPLRDAVLSCRLPPVAAARLDARERRGHRQAAGQRHPQAHDVRGRVAAGGCSG